MKVGVWINEYMNKEIGGGFSYTDRLINLIDNYKFSSEVEVVFLTKGPDVQSYSKEVICLELLVLHEKQFIKQRLINFIVQKSDFCKRLFAQSQKELKAKKINDYYRSQLINNKIDIIYYLSQTQYVIDDFPFISTNWDIGHLSMYAFPEVTNKKIFEYRNRWYNEPFKKALSIFSESEAGKEELISFLNINPDRIKVLPIFPGDVVNQKVSLEKQQDLLSSFELKKDKFFFYPAQFWAHKNHYNLLLAFKQLLLKESDLKLVFTGSDKGNLSYIKDQISNLNLTDNVNCLGFLELDSIYTLYKNAISLVMPTFLGPTNMPLLEARALECPVLCSDLKGHREQLGEGAVYFNPLEADDILCAMVKISNNDFKQKLLNIARDVNSSSKFNELNVIKTLEVNLIEISKYRHCWDY